MIQDILPLQLNNQYERKMPNVDSRVLYFLDNAAFIKKGELTDFMTYGELLAWCEAGNQDVPKMIFLFSIDETDYFLTELPEDFVNECVEYEFVRMFSMRAKKPKESVFVASTAWHLYCWYRDNLFCGRCGKKMKHDERQRMLFCECCGNQVFPKIAPAVIVGVTKGNYILMTKYANREYKRYALIAGFTEIGESVEETVRREVMEEVGLAVTNISYYKSQPWGFDSNLLLGFFCEAEEGQEIRMDEEELATAEWMHYLDVPADREGLSLTSEMMTMFAKSKGNC